VCIVLTCLSNAQVYTTHQNISGVINQYKQVTEIVPTCGVKVNNVTGLSPGYKVLIIQMTGAEVSLVNDATFGNITNIGDAGNYEFATIASVDGATNTVLFTKNLVKTYSPASPNSVQLITVPQYNGGATVTGILQPQAWNGSTGGVLVFEATTLTLNADIDATGRGFRPGIQIGNIAWAHQPDHSYRSPWNGVINNYNNKTVNINCTEAVSSSNPPAWAAVCGSSWRSPWNNGCGCTVTVPSCTDPFRFDPVTYGSGQHFSCTGSDIDNSGTVAEKGQGIHVVQNWYSRGRGKLANGGGGGTYHNGGGGGGSNYGKGGDGGRGLANDGSNSDTPGQVEAAGIGGVSLAGYYPNRIFMGGGGGAGHGNDNRASQGSEGGGIVIIKANTLQNPLGRKIMANGLDNTYNPPQPGGYDGMGGGGGGGVVLLDIANYSHDITVEAKGGKGRDNPFVPGPGAQDCYAPGGGGGGGVIIFTQNATPPSVTTNVLGGSRGIHLNPPPSCPAAHNGAQNGANGAVLHNLTLPEGNTNCPLPVDLISFNVTVVDENKVWLEWQTSNEKDNDKFEILRSLDGEKWHVVGTVKGSGENAGKNNYQFFDLNTLSGIHYYKIRQYDYSGLFKDSPIKSINIEMPNYSSKVVEIYPNPIKKGTASLHLLYYSSIDSDIKCVVTNAMGQTVLSQVLPSRSGLNKVELDVTNIQSGCYVLTIQGAKNSSSKMFLVY
jgi:hypothetical protein